MNQLPLIIKFRVDVQCEGFLASIDVDGRALAEEDDGRYWVYGVNPGGMAASGDDLGAAVADFLQRFRWVLDDIVMDFKTPLAFKTEVQRFFDECDAHTRADWHTAREAVRAGRHSSLGIKEDRDTRPAKLSVKIVTDVLGMNLSAPGQESGLSRAASAEGSDTTAQMSDDVSDYDLAA